MIAYRIVLSKYADNLIASGRPARWNSAGTFTIYTASSRALACLENLVHRSGEGLNGSFKTLVIDIPDRLKIATIQSKDLPRKWASFNGQLRTKFLGDAWAKSRETSVMKVPSAIIPEESNYLINPNHLEFSDIKISKVEDFLFDNRFNHQST